MTETIPPFYDDLAATLAVSWTLLARGATDRRAPFHTPSIATVGLDGAPQVRTVVLRAADPASRRLRFHTDRRSRKAEEIARDPRMALHFYDAAEKVQLRVAGEARVHEPGSSLADLAWRQSQELSRKCYGQQLTPGVRVTDPAAALAGTEDAEIGVANFAAVEVEVQRIEWLYLAHQGHRRALFEWDGEGAMRSTWLAP